MDYDLKNEFKKRIFLLHLKTNKEPAMNFKKMYVRNNPQNMLPTAEESEIQILSPVNKNRALRSTSILDMRPRRVMKNKQFYSK